MINSAEFNQMVALEDLTDFTPNERLFNRLTLIMQLKFIRLSDSKSITLSEDLVQRLNPANQQ
ncbi:hypothetical protein CS542_00845 [Pedobacter sp. IW39]|nr:hypothetical protein CS542_00845 [Pedobacter sp. IW39]